jgi:DNA-binding Lrp family transcriptional regulator
MGDDHSIRAVILITVPATRSGDLVTTLEAIPQVTQAGALFGDTDIYAMVVAENAETLKRVVMDQIQNLPDVKSTRTHVVIPDMFWLRESPTR